MRPLGAALLFALGGCARSAIELRPEDGAQPDLDDRSEDQAEIEDDEGAPAQEDASDDAPNAPVQPANDASAGSGDEGGGTRDAADVPDASTSAPADAGDSAAPDASGPEAGASTDASEPPVEAGAGATCNVLSCTNDCAISGPFRCCSERDTCGCTWAPGAYCL